MDKEFVIITVSMTLCTYGRSLLDTVGYLIAPVYQTSQKNNFWIPDSNQIQDNNNEYIFSSIPDSAGYLNLTGYQISTYQYQP